jgi:hypothetical protein
VLLLTAARLAIFSAGMRYVFVIDQVRDIVVGQQDNITATAPIAPIGSALGDVGLTAKAQAPVPAIACLQGYGYFIDKHTGSFHDDCPNDDTNLNFGPANAVEPLAAAARRLLL